MKSVFFSSFSVVKKSIIAVNRCRNQYFHASTIGFFLICLASVQNLRKGTLKDFCGCFKEWNGVLEFRLLICQGSKLIACWSIAWGTGG